jgi:hypothetical protein
VLVSTGVVVGGGVFGDIVTDLADFERVKRIVRS